VEFGTDSLADDILKKLGKNFTYSRVKKASEICRGGGLKFCHFIFAGSPGDTDEIVRLNLTLLEEIEPDAAVVMAGYDSPNTRLADIAREDLDRGRRLEPVFISQTRLQAANDRSRSQKALIMPLK
jgi:radical SAM superfamily enzyme YgiQ (UPF0313 family)